MYDLVKFCTEIGDCDKAEEKCDSIDEVKRHGVPIGVQPNPGQLILDAKGKFNMMMW